MGFVLQPPTMELPQHKASMGLQHLVHLVSMVTMMWLPQTRIAFKEEVVTPLRISKIAFLVFLMKIIQFLP
jgi:hypothetical protein